MGRDSRKNGEQGRQICADRPLQSDVVRLLIRTSHRTLIKNQPRLSVKRGESTCFQSGSYASEPNEHSRGHQMRGGEDEGKLCDGFRVN